MKNTINILEESVKVLRDTVTVLVNTKDGCNCNLTYLEEDIRDNGIDIAINKANIARDLRRIELNDKNIRVSNLCYE